MNWTDFITAIKDLKSARFYFIVMLAFFLTIGYMYKEAVTIAVKDVAFNPVDFRECKDLKDYISLDSNKGKKFTDYLQYLGDNGMRQTPDGVFQVSGEKKVDRSKVKGVMKTINQWSHDVSDFFGIKRDNISPLEVAKQNYGDGIISLKDRFGIGQGMAIHGTQIPERLSALNNPNSRDQDRNMSNMCVNLNGEALENCMKQLGTGSKVMIMPESGKLFNATDMKLESVPTAVKDYVKTMNNHEDVFTKKFGIDKEKYRKMIPTVMGIASKESGFGANRSYRAEHLAHDLKVFGSDHSWGTTQVNWDKMTDATKEKLQGMGITYNDFGNKITDPLVTMAKLLEDEGMNKGEKWLNKGFNEMEAAGLSYNGVNAKATKETLASKPKHYLKTLAKYNNKYSFLADNITK